MASPPPTRPCRGVPPKESRPRAPGRMPGRVPRSSARAPSPDSHLRRNQKPRLRPRQLRGAPVSLGRGRKGTQTEGSRFKGLLSELIHSLIHHSLVPPLNWYWVLGPKAGKSSEWVLINEAVMGKVALPTRCVGRPPQTASPSLLDVPSVPCPKQCRRTGTLQSNFCTSNLGKKPHLPALLVQQLSPPSGPQIPPPGSSPELASSLLTAHPHSPTVVTATVKSMVRGPGEGLTVTVSLIGAYKTGGLDLPSPLTDTPLKFYVPCKQCPPMKKGNRCG